jgi:hypothetical protein
LFSFQINNILPKEKPSFAKGYGGQVRTFDRQHRRPADVFINNKEINMAYLGLQFFKECV